MLFVEAIEAYRLLRLCCRVIIEFHSCVVIMCSYYQYKWVRKIFRCSVRTGNASRDHLYVRMI